MRVDASARFDVRFSVSCCSEATRFLLHADVGSVVEIVAAWVLPPTLEVIASRQTFTVAGERRIRFGDDGTSVVVEYDAEEGVVDYPGIALRATVV